MLGAASVQKHREKYPFKGNAHVFGGKSHKSHLRRKLANAYVLQEKIEN